MHLNHFTDAAAFLDRAAPFLVAREAEHNLLLGIAAGLVEQPVFYAHAPYLATVERDGDVVAAAMMTPPYNLGISLTDVPAALDAIARDVWDRQWAPPGVLAPSAVAGAFVARWRRVSGQAAVPGRAQRIYRLDTVVPVSGVPGTARRATAADRDLLVDWMRAFSLETMGDDEAARSERSVDIRLAGAASGFFLWDDGESVCMVGYGGPTPNGIRIGPVYTPPSWRNRGYASAATAAASQALLDEGRRFCFLFADLANPTANRIYQAIGYRLVCDVDEYRFVPGTDGADEGIRGRDGR